MPIRIEITANTTAELNELIAHLNRMSDVRVQKVETLTDAAKVVAHATAEPMDMGDEDVEYTTDEPPSPAPELPADDAPKAKRTRGRPPKTTPLDPNDDLRPGATKVEPTPAPAVEETPAQKLEKAIALLVALFTAGGVATGKVRDLQKKYGVSKFGDTPPERAGELLADAEALNKEINP